MARVKKKPAKKQPAPPGQQIEKPKYKPKKKMKDPVRYVDGNGKVRWRERPKTARLDLVDISPLARLTKMQRAFVNILLTMEDPDPEKAAKQAGYTAMPGSTLIRHPVIYEVYIQLLEEQNRKSKITQEKIVEELAALALMDPTDLLYDDDGTIKVRDLATLSPLQRKLVDKISVTNNKKMVDGEMVNETSFTLSSITSQVKLRALELLMKHKGMLIDKRQEEITHKINWEDYYSVRSDIGHERVTSDVPKIEEEVIDAEYEIEEFLDPPKEDA